jgi:hypothetical protein
MSFYREMIASALKYVRVNSGPGCRTRRYVVRILGVRGVFCGIIDDACTRHVRVQLLKLLQLVVRVVSDHPHMLLHQFNLLAAESDLVSLQRSFTPDHQQLFIQCLILVLLVLHVSFQRLVIGIDLRIDVVLHVLHLYHQVVHHSVDIGAQNAHISLIKGQQLIAKDHLLLNNDDSYDKGVFLTSILFTWWFTVLLGSSAMAADVRASGEKVLCPRIAILGL